MNLTLCYFNGSACLGELKIPYVRLERLKICASESGELPVFKLQPQESGQEGNFLLIIEHGTQSSRMAIKVSGICLKFYLLFPCCLADL